MTDTMTAPPVEDLDLEEAAVKLEEALRPLITTAEDRCTLEVRPALHFTCYGGQVKDSIEIFLRDRVNAVTRRSVVEAYLLKNLTGFSKEVMEKLSRKHPHPSEQFSRLQVLREGVNLLWKIIATGFPGEVQLEIQKRLVDGFSTLFPETWRGKPTQAAHYAEISHRLIAEVVARLNGGTVPAAAPPARRGRPRKEKNA